MELRSKKTIVLLLCACLVFALCSCIPDSQSAEDSKPASVFTVAGLTDQQRFTVEALEGLANQKGPSLILSNSAYWSDCAWNNKWIDIYKDQYGVKFKEIDGLMPLLKVHRGDYKGLVVYDPAINGSMFVAMTLSGVDDLLPVADPKPYIDQLDLKIVHDLRGKFTDSIQAYQWALKEVMPRCNKSFAHISAGPDVDGKYIGWGFEGYDYCVMNKGFLFNLSFSEKDKKSFHDRTIRGDKIQADMYREILAALEKPAYIVGYGEPEIEWFALIGEYGHQYLHWGDNLSFHAAVPSKSKHPKQKKHYTPENTVAEKDKYYVCFVMSEGDSMKGPVPFFFDSWFEKERGIVPINWTMPMTMSKFPAMLEYYYDNATDNDYFAGLQIYNYSMPKLREYAELHKKHAEAADYKCLNGAFNFTSDKVMDRKEKFFDIIQPLGVYDVVYEDCPEFGYQQFVGKNKDIPMVGTAYIMGYWHRLLGGWGVDWQGMLKDSAQYPVVVDKLSSEIEKIAGNHQPPFIIIVYGDLHAYDEHSRFYSDVAAKLDPERFKTARLDEAFSAIRIWHQEKGK